MYFCFSFFFFFQNQVRDELDYTAFGLAVSRRAVKIASDILHREPQAAEQRNSKGRDGCWFAVVVCYWK
jgi:hypothetical protein